MGESLIGEGGADKPLSNNVPDSGAQKNGIANNGYNNRQWNAETVNYYENNAAAAGSFDTEYRMESELTALRVRAR